MPNLSETPQWEDGIYQLETTDPVAGGPDGVDNLPHKLLANRTQYLRQGLQRLSTIGPDLATAGGVLTLPATGGYFVVTGAESLTEISARPAGEIIRLRWASARSIQHDAAKLILPDGVSITVAAGELTAWIAEGSGLWRLASYREPVGQIQMHGGGAAPSGWLLCDGAAVSRLTYAGLFAKLGVTWGAGDGNTTFNLPDLRGRSPLGAGQGSGLANRTLGQTGGAETHQLTIAETPSHTHKHAAEWYASGHPTEAAPASWPYRLLPHPDSGAPGAYVETVGGGGAHNNMHPFAVINFIIKT